MKLPKIGETVTTDCAIELCQHYGLDYLVQRINGNRNLYKEWVFDGVSCLPDKLAALVVNVDEHSLTYDCALPHDLYYAYGEPYNETERKRVDVKFQSDLVTKTRMDAFWAEIFYQAVRIGGKQLGLSFTWAFARK